MKKIISNLLVTILVGATAVSCGQNTAKSTLKKATIEIISPKQFKENSKNEIIIDVRTVKEFVNGHLKNAVNIDFYNKNHLENFKKFNKEKPLYVYCRSGRRSNIVASELIKMGFKKVYDLKGGIIAWENNRFKVEK